MKKLFLIFITHVALSTINLTNSLPVKNQREALTRINQLLAYPLDKWTPKYNSDANREINSFKKYFPNPLFEQFKKRLNEKWTAAQEIIKLKKQFSTQGNKQKKTEITAQELQKTLQTSQQKLEQKKAKYRTLKQQLNTQKMQNKTQVQELKANLTNQIKSLTEQIRLSSQAEQESEKKLQEQKTKTENLIRKNEKLSEIHKKEMLKLMSDHHKILRNMLETRPKPLKETIDKLKKQLENFQAKTQRLEEQITKYNKTIDTLEKANEESIKYIESNEKRYNQVYDNAYKKAEQDFTIFRKNLETSQEKTIGKLTNEIQTLKNQLTKAKQEKELIQKKGYVVKPQDIDVSYEIKPKKAAPEKFVPDVGKKEVIQQEAQKLEKLKTYYKEVTKRSEERHKKEQQRLKTDYENRIKNLQSRLLSKEKENQQLQKELTAERSRSSY